MNSFKIKIILVVLSVIFVVRVVTFFAADARFDSSNAELYFTKYSVLCTMDSGQSERLHLLERAINLCPTKAEYHLNYALTLSRMVKNPNIQTKACILSELKTACELKPFSGLYRGIYEKYSQKYGVAAGKGK